MYYNIDNGKYPWNSLTLNNSFPLSFIDLIYSLLDKLFNFCTISQYRKMEMIILLFASSHLLRLEVITNPSVVQPDDEQSLSIAAEKDSVFCLCLSHYFLDGMGNLHLIISLLASFL